MYRRKPAQREKMGNCNNCTRLMKAVRLWLRKLETIPKKKVIDRPDLSEEFVKLMELTQEEFRESLAENDWRFTKYEYMRMPFALKKEWNAYRRRQPKKVGLLKDELGKK